MRRVHFYNGGMVRRREPWAEHIEPFIEHPHAWERWDTLWTQLNSWDSLYDRTGALAHPLRIENLRPMPMIDQTFSQSLETLVIDRALSLAAEDQPLRLFWSGGIDSTLVVSAFIMAGVPVDQLELLFTQDSVTEYPDYLVKFVPAGVRRTEVKAFPHHNFVPDASAHQFVELPCMGDFVDPTRLNVTGGLGDKLFNSHTILTRFGYARALKPYRSVLPASLVEATLPLVAACPLPIQTLSQFSWWVYFALNYQDELLQLLAGVSDDSVTAKQRALRVFFDTDGFQQWSFHHRDQAATDAPAKLKLEAKRLIFKHTGDANYLETKLKSGSLKFRKTPNVAWDSPILFILDDGSVIRPG